MEIKTNKTLMETIKKEPITPKKVIRDIEDKFSSKKMEEVAEVKKLSWKEYIMQIDWEKVLIGAVVIGVLIYVFTKGGDPLPPSEPPKTDQDADIYKTEIKGKNIINKEKTSSLTAASDKDEEQEEDHEEDSDGSSGEMSFDILDEKIRKLKIYSPILERLVEDMDDLRLHVLSLYYPRESLDNILLMPNSLPVFEQDKCINAYLKKYNIQIDFNVY